MSEGKLLLRCFKHVSYPSHHDNVKVAIKKKDSRQKKAMLKEQMNPIEDHGHFDMTKSSNYESMSEIAKGFLFKSKTEKELEDCKQETNCHKKLCALATERNLPSIQTRSFKKLYINTGSNTSNKLTQSKSITNKLLTNYHLRQQMIFDTHLTKRETIDCSKKDYRQIKQKYLSYINSEKVRANKLIIQMHQHQLCKEERRKAYNPYNI